jgi:hypothetical protein
MKKFELELYNPNNDKFRGRKQLRRTVLIYPYRVANAKELTIRPAQFTKIPGLWWLVPSDASHDKKPEYPIGPFDNLRAAIRAALVIHRMS